MVREIVLVPSFTRFNSPLDLLFYRLLVLLRFRYTLLYLRFDEVALQICSLTILHYIVLHYIMLESYQLDTGLKFPEI